MYLIKSLILTSFWNSNKVRRTLNVIFQESIQRTYFVTYYSDHWKLQATSPTIFILKEDKYSLKIRGRNISNLYYVEDAILITKNVKDVQILIIKVK